MRIFLLSFFLFNICLLHGQLKDSSVRKYFVMESHNFFKSSRIVKEGQRIFVRDTSGKMLRGILTIFNDTLFEVHNLTTGIRDTFNIKALDKVKRPTLSSTIVGSVFLVVGIPFVIAGAYYIAFSYGDEVLQFIGVFSAITGVGSLASGLSGIYGKRFYFSDYKFRIIQTKGFKLKRRYIKHL